MKSNALVTPSASPDVTASVPSELWHFSFVTHHFCVQGRKRYRNLANLVFTSYKQSEGSNVFLFFGVFFFLTSPSPQFQIQSLRASVEAIPAQAYPHTTICNYSLSRSWISFQITLLKWEGPEKSSQMEAPAPGKLHSSESWLVGEEGKG